MAAVLSSVLLKASRSPLARRAVTAIPVTRKVVDRFVAGEDQDAAIAAVRALGAAGPARDPRPPRRGHHRAPRRPPRSGTATSRCSPGSSAEGLAEAAEVSVKLSALGQALPDGGEQLALDNARAVCAAAAAAGTTVTLDMEDHTTIDSTLRILKVLREDYPWLGAVLQSMLHRTEQDCRDLAYPGSRIRLVKGAYAEPASVAHQDKPEVDAAYERCLGILMAGGGYPMVGQPRLPDDPRRPGRSACDTAASRATMSSRCSTASARTSSSRRPARASGCASTCPSAPTGTATSCAGWPNAPPTCGFFLRALIGR